MLKLNLQSVFKKSIAVIALPLIAAACSPFATTNPGSGVAKTENGGSDWKLVNRADTTQLKKKPKTAPESPLAASSVFSMEFSPEDSRKIYATTQGQGVFYSENSTETWKQVLNTFNAFDITIDPTNPDRLYVAGQAGERARVLASTNRGKSWDEIYNDAVVGNAARSVVLDPADPKSIIVGLESGNILSSRDSGATWSLIQNFQNSISHMVWHQSRALYILTRGKGLYVSFDGGLTVENISKQLLDLDALRQQTVSAVGTDKTAVVPVDIPPQSSTKFFKVAVGQVNASVLYVAADNGLFTSSDRGATWRYLKLPLRNTQVTEVRGLALTADDAVVYASVGNTVFKTINGGVSWQVTAIATPATINYILVDPALPQIAYAGFIGSQ